MPELPEVETVRRKIEKAFRGQKIVEVHGDPEDRFFFAQASLNDVREALLGATLRGSGRKGKYFWLELDRRPWPLLHLGMTGNVEIKPAASARAHEKAWGGLRLWSNRGEPGTRLFFCRLLLVAENGAEIAITDPRRFGRVWLSEDPLLHPRVKKLGFDPLQKFPTGKELALLLARRKAPIKAVLLDQKLFAGVGNWIADEILYQAKIAPRRLASSLGAPEVNRLRAKTLAIVKKAVAVGANYEKFPRGWLFPYRWGKEKNARTYAKLKIRHDEIGGRTTAWVPSIQK